MLGLPDSIRACLFDLDGVLTKTAVVHARAWKEMFDEELDRRGGVHEPFGDRDYEQYIDGLPRYDGVRNFLRSRGIEADDAEVRRLGDRKNELVQAIIDRDGVEAYDHSTAYVRAAREAGLRCAVVSSSTNAVGVLQAAGLRDLFTEVVDGHVVGERGLRGKPAPDTFLEAARRLAVEPKQAAVFEDAIGGVEAGRAGDFGFVVGVDRVGHRDALLAHGADTVVDDLSALS